MVGPNPDLFFCQGSDPRVRSHPVNFNPSYKDLTEKMFRERDRERETIKHVFYF